MFVRAVLASLASVAVVCAIACSGGHVAPPTSAPSPSISATPVESAAVIPPPREVAHAVVTDEERQQPDSDVAVPAADSAAADETRKTPPRVERPAGRPPVDGSIVITMDEFNRLAKGLNYDEAYEVVGYHAEELSRSDVAGYSTVMVMWQNADGSNANAMFQNNRLIQRSQFGLPQGPSPMTVERRIQELERIAELQREQEEASRQYEEKARREEAELAERDKAAAPKLDAILASAGELADIESVDAFGKVLTEFQEEHAGTETADRAKSEFSALAKLRLAYLWGERTRTEPKEKLQTLLKEKPGTVAARVAEARLASH